LGTRPGEATLIAVLGTLALVRVACVPTEPTGPVDPRVAEVLANLGPNVILPAYRDFRDVAETLVAATAAFDASGGVSGREAAQEAWRTSMMAWQVAEVMQVGPAGSSVTVVAGVDLRDEIYSWPSVHPCRVDQKLVEATWDEPDFFDGNLVNVYGLDAIEYLLFHAGPDNVCAAEVAINAEGTWAALGEAEIDRRRAAYAAALAAHVLAEVDRLIGLWEVGFDDELANAGNTSTVYGSADEALDAIYRAIFYIEASVKDMKLAKPLGLLDCAAASCPEAVESRWARHSIENVRANLDGFERMFWGGAGAGFDDLLFDVDADEVEAEVRAALDGARAAAGALPSLEAAVEGDVASGLAVHTAVRGLTDLLKDRVPAYLSVVIPAESAGDAD
jgi:predicted lipoprotein